VGAVVALFAAAGATSAEIGRFTLSGTVTRVVDGDTIVVKLKSGKRERVRLIGIDTPELNPAECFGREAKVRAQRLAQGKRVRLLGDATQDTRDRYRRLLAYVVLPQRIDLGRRLIAGGFGKVYVYDRPFARLGSYRAAESSARSSGRGLWRACSTPPPPPPPPPPGPPPPPPPPGQNCHASYPTVCIPPPPPDLDCGQIPHRNFVVRWDVPDPDPHRFDGDRDGTGCET
jgi:micrococcal nuclease